MTDARLALVTAPDARVAETMVDALLQERLIACGNILPGLRSVYRWQGAIERADEVLLLLKTTAHMTDALITRVRHLHPYDVPEVLVLDVDAGLGDYLSWIAQSVASGGVKEMHGE
ncbi:MAG: divalent-cation tolerance protein CutA [Longimicrobiales bacterium]